jgi:hypothetical protein
MSDIEKTRAEREARESVKSHAGSPGTGRRGDRSFRGYVLSQERRKRDSAENPEKSTMDQQRHQQ